MASEQKKQLVQQLTTDLDQYPIVGVVNLQHLPAQQLQVMRSMLKSKGVKLSMARKKLLYLALSQAKKKNLDQLSAKIKGMPALLFTKENPFALNTLIVKNKSEAPAKAGQTAPKDIVIKAGPTSFAPGPIISELAAVGIKTKVNAGKLEIIQDVTVAKEGDIISAKLAETLKRLDVKPMEVGLNLVAVWEEGLVFDSKQLHIDEKEYAQNIAQAATWAMNVAVEAAYPTSETTELLVQKAFREAKVVGVEYAIVNKDTGDEILARSERQALSLKREANL
ncbi:MAG: 50S ribosomal protein L10 [Nanoarchaeota archaeon]